MPRKDWSVVPAVQHAAYIREIERPYTGNQEHDKRVLRNIGAYYDGVERNDGKLSSEGFTKVSITKMRNRNTRRHS